MTPGTVQAVAHHGITVARMDRALDFFVGVLGFEPQPELQLEESFAAGVTGVAGARIRVVFVQAPGLMIELLEYLAPPDRRASGARPCDAGSSHLALSVTGIESLVDAAVEAGWRLAGEIRTIVVGPRAGGLAAYLTDDDGTVVELVQHPVTDQDEGTTRWS